MLNIHFRNNVHLFSPLLFYCWQIEKGRQFTKDNNNNHHHNNDQNCHQTNIPLRPNTFTLWTSNSRLLEEAQTASPSVDSCGFILIKQLSAVLHKTLALIWRAGEREAACGAVPSHSRMAASETTSSVRIRRHTRGQTRWVVLRVGSERINSHMKDFKTKRWRIIVQSFWVLKQTCPMKFYLCL